MAQIIWHDSAKEHLADIFTYYMDNVSQQVAYSFLHSILTGVESLANMPRKGARELLLANRKYEYRHLVIRRNYKSIQQRQRRIHMSVFILLPLLISLIL